MRFHNYNKLKGFTLTEILLVLVIAAAIVISAFIIYPKVKASDEIKKETYNITTIFNGSKSIFSSKADYSGWDLIVLDQADALPKDMIIKMNEYRSAWGLPIRGSMYQDPSTSKYTGFTLIYQVPTDHCTKFVSAVYPMTTVIKSMSVYLKKDQGEAIDVNKISTACASPYMSNIVNIELSFTP